MDRSHSTVNDDSPAISLEIQASRNGHHGPELLSFCLVPGWMPPREQEEADVDHSKHGTTYHELTHLTEKELRRRVDLLMAHDHEPLTASDYRNELNRRAADRQTTWLVRLTWVIAALTVVLTIATVVLLIRGG